MEDNILTDGSKFVVSLATHARRYDKLQKTLPYILVQSLHYDTLLINVQDDLSDEDFRKFEKFAEMDRRIIVKRRPAKWRSFNKFIHAAKEYPNHSILTCDDDIRYSPWMFEQLVKASEENPGCIIAHELNPVGLDRVSGKIVNRMIADIKLRQRCFNKYLTGCAFFPKGIFTADSINDMSDYDSFYDITHGTHDELWMWIHSTIQGTPVIGLDYTWSFDFDGAFPPDDSSLCRINGNPDEVKSYDSRINANPRYGRKLYEMMDSTPIVFKVSNSNLLAICHCMETVNHLYRDFKIVFDCTDRYFQPSMLRMLVNSVNSQRWYRNITFKTNLVGDISNGVEEHDLKINQTKSEDKKNGKSISDVSGGTTMKNCVAYVVDNNKIQLMFLRNSIDTLKKNYDGDVFVIVDEDFAHPDMFNDCKICTIPKSMIEKYLPKRRKMLRGELSYAIFYRLLIPILPEFRGYEQVLYLDCDTEVIKPIDDVFNNNINEFYGVNEWWLMNEHNARLGHIKHLEKYCNSGVLLINLFRISDYEDKLSEMNLLQNSNDFRNPDQDMLNLCFDVGILDRKYNSYPRLEDTSSAVVLHYVNALKNDLMKKIVKP